MSLQLRAGASSRKSDSILLGGGRSRSLGAGESSFAPCWGGFVSTNASGPVKGRQPGLHPSMSKPDYALALDRQIAARKALQAPEVDEPSKPIFGNNYTQAAAERVMGARIGGPMPPTSKAHYALTLEKQIEERKARHAAEASEFECQDVCRGDDMPTEACKRSRRGLPPLPSKQVYASELQHQIELRDAERAVRILYTPEVGDQRTFPTQDSPKGHGRRHTGPMVPITKDSYATHLDDQIAEKEMHQAMERVRSRSPLCAPMSFGSATEKARGRRHEIQIAQTSKTSYLQTLQEQIADRQKQQEAEAYHCQQPEPTLRAPCQRTRSQGRRLGGPMVPDTKDDYASALKEQIVARDAERRLQDASTIDNTPHVGVEAFTKGRRHVGQIPCESKQAVSSILQQQMAEHSSNRAANAFHKQTASSADSILPAGDMELRGRRHVAPVEPMSKQAYASALEEQIAKKDLHQSAGCLSVTQLPPKSSAQSSGFSRSHSHQPVRGEKTRPQVTWDFGDDALERFLHDHADGCSP